MSKLLYRIQHALNKTRGFFTGNMVYHVWGELDDEPRDPKVGWVPSDYVSVTMIPWGYPQTDHLTKDSEFLFKVVAPSFDDAKAIMNHKIYGV